MNPVLRQFHPSFVRSVLPLVLTMSFCLLALAGCWIPEKFDARVDVHRDGSYDFVYDGTLAFAPVLFRADNGFLSQREEDELRQKAVSFREESGYREFRYIGNGRFKVRAEKHATPGEEYYFMSEGTKLFAVESPGDGMLSIEGVTPAEDIVRQLSSSEDSLSGTLTVSVPWGAKVLRHNADREPFFFGLFGDYSWEITDLQSMPFIEIQL